MGPIAWVQAAEPGLALLLLNACAALQDWHMLHANEAWRQLTGAELQRGVSTGLWESFEFLAVQPQASGIFIASLGVPWMQAS